ncbi:hypothetical protein FHG87_008394 [Trinorchestia longiramus]|nr:hypothetical protein FHG87_008394 [Trinorchestia longiramus]
MKLSRKLQTRLNFRHRSISVDIKKKRIHLMTQGVRGLYIAPSSLKPPTKATLSSVGSRTGSVGVISNRLYWWIGYRSHYRTYGTSYRWFYMSATPYYYVGRGPTDKVGYAHYGLNKHHQHPDNHHQHPDNHHQHPDNHHQHPDNHHQHPDNHHQHPDNHHQHPDNHHQQLRLVDASLTISFV